MKIIQKIMICMLYCVTIKASYGSDELDNSSVVGGIGWNDYQNESLNIDLGPDRFDADDNDEGRQTNVKKDSKTDFKPLQEVQELEITQQRIHQLDLAELTPAQRRKVQIDKEIAQGLRSKNGILLKQAEPVLSSTQKAISIKKQVTSIVNDAFASIDSWAEKDLVDIPYSKKALSQPGRNKKTICLNKLHQALQKLETVVDASQGLQELNSLAERALNVLSDPVKIGRGKGSAENKIIAGVINAVKATIKMSLVASVQASGLSIGAAGGAIAGAGTGLVAGVYRTVTGKIDSNSLVNRIIFQDVDGYLVHNAPKLFVNTLVKTLYHVVKIPVLVAYGASEGFVLGGLLGVEAPVQAGKKIVSLQVKKNSRIGSKEPVPDGSPSSIDLSDRSDMPIARWFAKPTEPHDNDSGFEPVEDSEQDEPNKTLVKKIDTLPKAIKEQHAKVMQQLKSQPPRPSRF